MTDLAEQVRVLREALEAIIKCIEDAEHVRLAVNCGPYLTDIEAQIQREARRALQAIGGAA